MRRWVLVIGALVSMGTGCGRRALRGDAGDAGDAPLSDAVDAGVDTDAPLSDAVDAAGPSACATDASPYEASHTVNDPCAVDSDCHHPFLACRPLNGETCQVPAAPTIDPCGPVLIGLPDVLPICPETARVNLLLCTARYDLPCRVDSDCGPDGFECVVDGPCVPAMPVCGSCRETRGGECATVADCPTGWECTDLCRCAGRPSRTSCYPPFAQVHCPACMGVSDEDGGAPPN